MSIITDILSAKDIKAALRTVEDEGSFDYRIFKIVGLDGKSSDQAKMVFDILDRNQNGFIEEDEIGLILQSLDPSARQLTKEEVKTFMEAADTNGDGKIDADEFVALVKKANS